MALSGWARTDSLPARPARPDHALDQPPHLPAAHGVQQPPSTVTRRHDFRAALTRAGRLAPGMGGRLGHDLRSRPRRGVIGLPGAMAFLAVAPAASHATVNFNVKGKWVCNNRGTVSPIAGARVELWHSIDYWFDDNLGSTHAATDGSFNFGVQAGGNFDLYAKAL